MCCTKRHRSWRSSRPYEPYVPFVARAQLQAVRLRADPVADGHLDAARRAGLVGPEPHAQRFRARSDDGAAVPADAAVRDVRRTARGPVSQAAAVADDAGGERSLRGDTGRARRDWRRT